MPPHRRRMLFSDDPNHGDCNGWGKYGCYSPPSPPTASPSPSPADGPSPWASPSPGSAAPAPSPFRHPAAGRRDQGGTSGYGPAAGAGHHRYFVNYIIIAVAAFAFLSLILLGVSVAVRRRQLRRRRQALLSPAPAVVTNVGNDDPEAGGGGGGGVVHHVWYIRTVGLDEAAIDSIAVTRYRAGAGLLGAADCSVCLGEFQDGELVRLLPKCAHAFHVPCIDTWLRAHVNCPLCRSDVLDPAASVATGVAVESNSEQSPADPDVNANAAAEQVDAASNSTLEQEDEEENAPHLQEDQQEQQFSTREPLPQLPCPLPWNVRRAASMDAAIASTAANVAALDRLPEAAPEGEQSGRDKHRSGATGHLSNPGIERPAPSGAPRSFFSRHCRARSSVLPL